MASIQETVDEIRGYVVAGGRTPTAAFASRAEEYAQACREVNDRLRRCSDALHRGLRSDAIQLAEAEPNLLDVVAMLDFPELAGWKVACQTYELPTPPELLIEMAGELNEAYAAEQPLATLMANHRVMALARAPLSERLTVMRRIAELDPASTFWDEDIRRFEEGRLSEMGQQLNKAIKAQDAALVGRLREEADASTWRVAVPQDLLRLLKESADRLTATKAIADLRALLPKLNDAYSAMAYEDCKRLLGQWLATVASAKLSVPTDLQEQVEPIIGWVQEQDQRRKQQAEFEQVCDVLQQALDRDQPTPMLERAYHAVLPFHLEIPEDLDRRYRQKLTARAIQIRQRRKLLYAGIAAAFVLIAAAITIVTYQHLLSREVSEAQTTLAGALTDVQHGELEKGANIRKELADQHPRVLNNSLIISTLNDFDSAVSAERQREADFQKHMQAAIAGGVEKPAESEFEQATAMAKSPAEIAQVEQFKSSLDEFRARKEQEADRQFVSDGAAIGTELDQKLTTQLMTAYPDDYGQQLAAIGKRIEELRQRNGVSSGLKQAQLASLDAVLGRHKDDFDRQRNRTRLLSDVRKFGSTAERHAAALKEFISAFPDDEHSRDFQAASDQLPLEQAVEDWSSLVSGWSSEMLPPSYDSATSRVAAIQQYIDHHSASPLIDSVQTYQAYLKLGLETAAPDGPWKGKLSKLLSNPIVGKLYYLETADTPSLRFYVSSEAKVEDRHAIEGPVTEQVFDAITSPDLTHPSQVTGHMLKSTTPLRSPQANFAETIGGRIDSLGYRDWDVFGIDVMQGLVSQKEIDPVLQAILLQHIVQLNQPTANWSGEDGFGKVADMLTEQNVEDIEWLDPRHPPDANTITKLKSTIDKLPLLGPAKTALLKRRDAILQAAEIAVVSEGVLLREQDAYELVSAQTPSAGQVALVIGPDKKLEQVGQAKDNGWSLDSSKATTVPDGSLVFIVSPAK
jgi:hypothetical protein